MSVEVIVWWKSDVKVSVNKVHCEHVCWKIQEQVRLRLNSLYQSQGGNLFGSQKGNNSKNKNFPHGQSLKTHIIKETKCHIRLLMVAGTKPFLNRLLSCICNLMAAACRLLIYCLLLMSVCVLSCVSLLVSRKVVLWESTKTFDHSFTFIL